MDNSRNNYFDMASLFLQLYSLIILIQDYKNSDLMQELQNQDEKYLNKIIEQNEKIIDILERSNNNDRKN